MTPFGRDPGGGRPRPSAAFGHGAAAHRPKAAELGRPRRVGARGRLRQVCGGAASFLPPAGPATRGLEQMMSRAPRPPAPPRDPLLRAARSGGPSGLSAWLAAPKGSEPKAGGCNLWACRGRFLSRDPAHSRAHQVAFPPPPQPLSKTSSFYLPLRFSSGSHF